ncbi:restriction endonuclease subunit S [Rhizobium sp. BK376]|uniref:restriction endonuclease subunit S n=1 Tax=Rhizobium sp. BK376 TaxID=2512149 RepID=UPI001048CD21|nr:restriction endonuclease subunit S [Rhizobium sp. BK376]TCR81529.1 type I restriction enzyme S subunit [Rhizobium sp. BK376]
MTPVIQKLSEYSSYQPSGVDWIGEVPSHWDIVRFKHGLRLVTTKGGNEDHKIALENIESWSGRYLETDTTYEGEGTSFRAGDILFGKLRPYLAKALLATSNGQAVGDFHVLRPAAQTNPRFAQYFVLSRDFISIVDGSTYGAKMPRASWDFISSLPLPLPPLAEQAAIVTFLDRETAKIDALVEEQRRLIDLLKEKRQAAISHAVTNGLNPNAPMKDTGIEWLGKVPEHWPVTPLKYVAGFQSGGTPSKANPDYWEGSVPWASAKDLKSDLLATTLDSITEAALQDGAASLVPAGSIIVLVRGMMLARAFPVCVSTVPMAINQDLKAVNGVGIDNDFLAWVLRGLERETLSRLDEAGHGTKALRMDAWTSMNVPIPPLDEQQAIAAHLEQETKKNERLQAAAERAITLLQERRSALIAAAVTGKIDVRHQQTPAADATLVRAAVGFEVVRRLAHRPTFGRVKLQKLVYLAETYAGIEELGGSYQREAAGPLDRALISDIERLLQRDGEVLVAQPDGRGSAVAYRFSGPRPKVEREDLGPLLGDRRERFEQVLTKVGDLDTKGAEAVATLFAVWNDALLDRATINDEGIITGFLTEWHHEKPLKFKRDELHTWLGWMRRNGIIPMGQGPRTQTGRLVI